MDYQLESISHLPSKQADLLYSLLFYHDNSKDLAVVYTDGACSMQGTNKAKAAFGVFWGCDHPNNHKGKVHGLQDNNRAELCGAEHAIKQAFRQGYKAITILSDSNFVKRVIDKPKDFIGSSHSDFHDIMDNIRILRSHIKISVKYVQAHAGHYENEQADQLAKAAVRTISLETVFRYTRRKKTKSSVKSVMVPTVGAQTRHMDQKKRYRQGNLKKAKDSKKIKQELAETTEPKPKKPRQICNKKIPIEIPPEVKTLIRSLSKNSLTGGVRKRNSWALVVPKNRIDPKDLKGPNALPSNKNPEDSVKPRLKFANLRRKTQSAPKKSAN